MTIVRLPNRISKARFKAHALEICRTVERTREPVVITHHGVPVLSLAPYTRNANEARRGLGFAVTRYDDPLSPVAPRPT